MLKRHVCCLIVLLLYLTGCFISAGTHGSIKGYQYSTKKEQLQRAVMAVIKSNPNISRDTSLDYLGSSPLLDSDTNMVAGENFYNDVKHYVTIKITSGDAVNEYTFRYYGPDESWPTTDSSEIFICYARDKYRQGGSEDNGITKENAKKFTDIFEKEFVSKIDKELGLQHTVD